MDASLSPCLLCHLLKGKVMLRVVEDITNKQMEQLGYSCWGKDMDVALEDIQAFYDRADISSPIVIKRNNRLSVWVSKDSNGDGMNPDLLSFLYGVAYALTERGNVASVPPDGKIRNYEHPPE